MSRFTVANLPLPGLKLVERRHLEDNRGFLSRLFCADELAAVGWVGNIVQVNHTLTRLKGAVRGLHFQHPPYAEMKLVSCIKGEVWDVAVDVRAGSPTFLNWHAERLSPDNSLAMLLPEGFAHGFQALTENVELIYCHSAAYNASSEAGINPQDERVAVSWPLEIADLSSRDAQHPLLGPEFTGVTP